MNQDIKTRRHHALNRRRAIGVGGLGLLCGLSSRSTNAFAADSQVRIVNPSGHFPLTLQYLLQNGGYFKDFGVTPDFLNVQSGSQILSALVSGSSDICCGGGFFSVFPAIQGGAKLKILAGMSMTPVTAVYTTKPDVKSAKDLVGKTIGTGAIGTLLYELAVAWLIRKGVDYKKVNFVNVGSAPNVLKAVIAGVVDAGVGEQDTVSEQKKYGVRILSDGALWNELPDFTNAAFYAPDQAIAEKRDLLVRTLAGYAKLFRYLTDPASKETFLAARKAALGVDEPVDGESEWNFYRAPGRLGTQLVISEERIKYVQQLNLDLGTQKVILPYHQVADMSLANDALKLI